MGQINSWDGVPSVSGFGAALYVGTLERGWWDDLG